MVFHILNLPFNKKQIQIFQKKKSNSAEDKTHKIQKYDSEIEANNNLSYGIGIFEIPDTYVVLILNSLKIENSENFYSYPLNFVIKTVFLYYKRTIKESKILISKKHLKIKF